MITRVRRNFRRAMRRLFPGSLDERPEAHAAPADPTLAAAQRELAVSIQEKAAEIDRLSQDIVAMTTSLIAQFKDNGRD